MNQKGNPVQFRSCTRSCKPTQKVSESRPLLMTTGRRRKPGEPEDLPISLCFCYREKRQKFLCEIFQVVDIFIIKIISIMRSSLLVIFMLLCVGFIITSCHKEDVYYFPTVDFETLTIPSSGYWNGSDASGSFAAGILKFNNSFNASWKTWAGFAYSQKSDFTTKGYENQYSVFDSKNGNNKYALFYPSFDASIFAAFPANELHQIQSMDLCNSTYTALSMKNGDSYCKKFGGITGTDPDWFKITIIGYDQNGLKTGSVNYYLADFRFPDFEKDFVINKWTTVDLTALGKINQLSFEFSSSDTGSYGINTPTYVCLDNIMYMK